MQYNGSDYTTEIDKLLKSSGIREVRTWMRENLTCSERIDLAVHNIQIFCLYYLGSQLPAHQRRWTDLFKVQFLLKLAPRDHGKSWVWVFAYVVWRLYLDFYLNKFEEVKFRVLISSKTDLQAKKLLGQIKGTIESNPYLYEDFGDIRGPKWLEDYIVCKRKTVSLVAPEKDPTVEVVGVLGAITGGHFNIIIIDDMLDDENTKTSERLATISNWFHGTIWNLREPATQIIVIGTRKKARDTYQELIENPVWVKDVEGAVLRFPGGFEDPQPGVWEYIRNEHGIIIGVNVMTTDYQVLWPQEPDLDEKGQEQFDPLTGKQKTRGWSIQSLLMDRAAIGKTVFNREKQNKIDTAAGSIFKSEWFRYFPSEELEVSPGGVILTV